MSAELDTEILSQIPVLIFGGLKSNISVNVFFSRHTKLKQISQGFAVSSYL